MFQRPEVGAVYYAPVAVWESQPLVFGERRGLIVNTPSQDVGVVYTSRDAAAAALEDRSQWGERNASLVRVAGIRYRGIGSPRFTWADDAERVAHDAARYASRGAL